MTLYLLLILMMVIGVVAGGFFLRWLDDTSAYHGTETELERQGRRDLKERQTKRQATGRLGPAESGHKAQEAEHRRQVEFANELREERELTKLESEEVRDGLLAQMAQRVGLNLVGAKGESLISHGTTIPASVVESFDRGRSLFCELKGLGTHYDLTLRLQLTRESNVHLKIRRTRAVARETAQWTQGLDTGDERFDRAYLLEGKGFLSIEPLQQLPEARAAVDRIFALGGMGTLSIRKGQLRVEGEVDADLDREGMAALLPALRTLASIYEGDPPQAIQLKAQIVIGTGGTCPYCRDVFDDDLEVIECEGCRTSLHSECHEENGGCPVLGCGVQSTRARQLS